MTKKQKIQLSVVIVITFISILFFKSHQSNNKTNLNNPQKETSSIMCSKVIIKNFAPLIDFSGRINSSSKINIVSEVNGVSKISPSRFEVGEEFKRGDVLIHIKDEDVDLELKSIKSQFLSLLVQVLPDLKMDFPALGTKFQKYINNFSLQGSVVKLPNTTSSKQRNFLTHEFSPPVF